MLKVAKPIATQGGIAAPALGYGGGAIFNMSSAARSKTLSSREY
jgi:hypothetical protein